MRTWKKRNKLPGNVAPRKRAEYLRRFRALYDQMRRGEALLVHVDESHLHRGLDLGYTWLPRGA